MVIELTSKTTMMEDIEEKYNLYVDKLGVKEYFLFDPKEEYLKPSFQGYRKVKDRFRPIKPIEGSLPSKELGLHLERVGVELRLWNPADGTRLPTPGERANIQAERAEQEAERAEQEAERARQAEEEIERLRREIERLRGKAGREVIVNPRHASPCSRAVPTPSRYGRAGRPESRCGRPSRCRRCRRCSSTAWRVP